MKTPTRPIELVAALAIALAALPAPVAAQATQKERIKVLADQDSAGPQGTNFLSLLMLLMAEEEVDLLGITTVSGDQWVKPSTVFALHALELTGRTEVPVVQGAELPLLNTRAEQERREALYGSHPTWHGSFNPDAPPPDRVWSPPGGMPKLQARPGHAVGFIIETLRSHPGEVVLYCAGPLTNIALAVRLAPDIVPLTRALYVMGASIEGGFELNWWWDPEAASIVMREPWKEIVVTPGEIGWDAINDAELMRPIVAAGGRLAEHVRSLYLDYQPIDHNTPWSAMWDEVAVAALLDPKVIAQAEEMYLDVVIDHGAKYGHTLVWKRPPEPLSFFLAYSGPDPVDLPRWKGHYDPPYNRHPAQVQTRIDPDRFRQTVVGLLSR